MALMVTKACFGCGRQYLGEYYNHNDCPECAKRIAREIRMDKNKKKRLSIVRRKCGCRIIK